MPHTTVTHYPTHPIPPCARSVRTLTLPLAHLFLPCKVAPAAAVQADLDDDEPAEQLYKVLVIGDYGVGKTSVRGPRRSL